MCTPLTYTINSKIGGRLKSVRVIVLIIIPRHPGKNCVNTLNRKRKNIDLFGFVNIPQDFFWSLIFHSLSRRQKVYFVWLVGYAS